MSCSSTYGVLRSSSNAIWTRCCQSGTRATIFTTAYPAAPATTATAQSSQGTSISWGPCNSSQVPSEPGVNITCGTLQVPLDYSNASSKAQLQLQLAKIPAVTSPAKGSILTNFGGPGDTARDELAAFGPVIQASVSYLRSLECYN